MFPKPDYVSPPIPHPHTHPPTHTHTRPPPMAMNPNQNPNQNPNPNPTPTRADVNSHVCPLHVASPSLLHSCRLASVDGIVNAVYGRCLRGIYVHRCARLKGCSMTSTVVPPIRYQCRAYMRPDPQKYPVPTRGPDIQLCHRHQMSVQTSDYVAEFPIAPNPRPDLLVCACVCVCQR